MGKSSKIKGWRKLAAAAWGPPNDPQIYGDLEIDAGRMLEFIDEARATKGVPLTVTHMVGKAIAHALGDCPDLNVRMAGGKFHRRESVDIFFIVSAEEGEELSGVKVFAADKKPVVEIAEELAARSTRIRTGDDVEFGKTKRMLGTTPRRLLGPAMRGSAWLTSGLNLDLKKQGLPRQAFGSAMISSVGMFGIQHAYAPLARHYRIPFLALVGEVADKAVVVDDKVVPRPMVTISATLDHRYVDGFHAARLARAAREYCEDPKRFEPALR